MHVTLDQFLDGFERSAENLGEVLDLDLLVQPEDMEPSGVARCSCLYDLTARVTRSGVGRIEDATRVLRVFERDDRYGSQGREPEVRLVAILGKWFDAYVTRTGT